MHAGKAQSRNALFRALYRRDYDGLERVLDNRISRLRRKLETCGADIEIHTIRGVGYLLKAVE